jgi:ketosteroid isomerase-like protein
MVASDADVVRALIAAVNAKDADAGRPLLSHDAELYPMRAQLEGRAYVGPDGFAELLGVLDEEWEGIRLEVGELVEGPDGVVIVGSLRATGRASGVDLDVPSGWHFRVVDDRVTYSRGYSDPDDALRAAGADPAAD